MSQTTEIGANVTLPECFSHVASVDYGELLATSGKRQTILLKTRVVVRLGGFFGTFHARCIKALCYSLINISTAVSIALIAFPACACVSPQIFVRSSCSGICNCRVNSFKTR